MAKRIAVVFLVATFLLCSFSYARARNNSEFNWRNSPQSQYYDHWKNSPLYWRNPAQRQFLDGWKKSPLYWRSSAQRQFLDSWKKSPLYWRNPAQRQYYDHWKNSPLYWTNSPERQYSQHWKNSPFYWRNPPERWFDKYWQSRLSTPIQEIDVILSPKGPMKISDSREEMKEPVRSRIITLYEGEEAAISSEDSGPTSGHTGWSIAVYGSEGTDGVYEHVAPRGKTFPGGSIVIYGLHKQ